MKKKVHFFIAHFQTLKRKMKKNLKKIEKKFFYFKNYAYLCDVN